MFSNLGRLGALGALLAAIAWLTSGILDLVTTRLYSLEEGLFIIALLGSLGGLAGLHSQQARRYGWLGTACFLVAFIGTTLLLIGLVVSFLSGGAVEIVSSENRVGVVLVGTLVGYVLLGILTVWAGVFPQWCGALLAVCHPVAIALGSYGGGIVLGLVWLGLGYVLLSQDELSALL